MSAAQIPAPIEPAYTNEDWREDFWFSVDDPAQPEDWTGSEVDLTLTRRGLTAYAWSASTAGGTIVAPDDSGRVSIRVPETTMLLVPPGVYDGQLRRRRRDGITETALIFVLPVIAGSAAA